MDFDFHFLKHLVANESENFDKYFDLDWEIWKLWNI